MFIDGITNEALSVFKTMEHYSEYYTASLFACTLLDGEHSETKAYAIVSKFLDSDAIANLAYDLNRLHAEAPDSRRNEKTNNFFKPYIKKAKRRNDGVADSAWILYVIISSDEAVRDAFKSNGLTKETILAELRIEKGETTKKKEKMKNSPIQGASTDNESPVEYNLLNLDIMVGDWEIENAVGNENVIETVFTILSKRRNNNVVIVGPNGVGKTTLALRIAYLVATGNCPPFFQGKSVMLMDFASLMNGTIYKGQFEAKIQSIVDDAETRGNYIFFADDIHEILSPSTRLSEMPTESVLDTFLSSELIPFICTTTEEGYSKYIASNQTLSKTLVRIDMKEKTIDECFGTVKNALQGYELYHNVTYPEDTVLIAMTLAKLHDKAKSLPESALDILDEAGAKVSMELPPNPEAEKVVSKIIGLHDEICRLQESTDRKEYDRIDELTREEIALKTALGNIEREEMEAMRPVIVTVQDVETTVSRRIGNGKAENRDNMCERLSHLSERIRSSVIGQDESVSTIVRAVKRKISGVSDQEKPLVVLMCGGTGVGKTMLAKTLAKELYEEPGCLVRLDMSEYSDKMSVNKFTGSSAGYVGYEEGGILTEAIKKKPRCVLLLDEIEKANGDVFNLLLQVFDEGRLTDNKGTLVSFKDVIIMMTSNVGSKEVSELSGRIGFTNGEVSKVDNELRTSSTLKKAIKNKFTPEFINRIDKILWFNSIGDDVLKRIISNEILKVNERISAMGFSLSDDVPSGKISEMVFAHVSEEREYGARPVIRAIEELIEDPLAELILSGEYEKGHAFTESEILKG